MNLNINNWSHNITRSVSYENAKWNPDFKDETLAWIKSVRD